MGLLGKIAKTQCLIGPFRNPPSEIEIRSCLLKLYVVHGDVVRKAKRENKNIAESELPILWILTPTFSSRMITGLGATDMGEDWVKGVYFLPHILKTAIVVIHQLPENEDTLWLRVLGKGGTQKRAVEELTTLPENNPFRENLLEILADWRKNLELRDNLSREEEEEIMNLSPAYLQQREEWKQEAKEEGRVQFNHIFVVAMNNKILCFEDFYKDSVEPYDIFKRSLLRDNDKKTLERLFQKFLRFLLNQFTIIDIKYSTPEYYTNPDNMEEIKRRSVRKQFVYEYLLQKHLEKTNHPLKELNIKSEFWLPAYSETQETFTPMPKYMDDYIKLKSVNVKTMIDSYLETEEK